MTALLSPHSQTPTVTILPISNIPVYANNTNYGSAASIQNYVVTNENDTNTNLLASVSSFYEELLATQEYLGDEFEDAIKSNISSLYEE